MGDCQGSCYGGGKKEHWHVNYKISDEPDVDEAKEWEDLEGQDLPTEEDDVKDEDE